MKKQNQVGDYLFKNDVDAELAAKEAEKISRLEDKMEQVDIELLYKLYNKSIEKKAFRTPVGYDFMRKLKGILENNPDTPGEVLPIPLDVSFSNAETKKTETTEVKTEASPQISGGKKSILMWSVFTNVVLVIMVILMFWIVSTGDHPNVINYENAVLNKYAQWEQELTERENELREAGY